MEAATEKLKVVEATVKELNDKLAKLTEQFDKANADKNAALAEADRCARRLNFA